MRPASISLRLRGQRRQSCFGLKPSRCRRVLPANQDLHLAAPCPAGATGRRHLPDEQRCAPPWFPRQELRLCESNEPCLPLERSGKRIAAAGTLLRCRQVISQSECNWILEGSRLFTALSRRTAVIPGNPREKRGP